MKATEKEICGSCLQRHQGESGTVQAEVGRKGIADRTQLYISLAWIYEKNCSWDARINEVTEKGKGVMVREGWGQR